MKLYRGKAGLCLALMAGSLVLAGCGALDEARQYHLKKEWGQLTAWNWKQTAGKIAPLERASPADNPCTYFPTERRTTRQSGIQDEIAYTQCWNSPYYSQYGQRLGNRPEPQSAARE